MAAEREAGSTSVESDEQPIVVHPPRTGDHDGDLVAVETQPAPAHPRAEIEPFAGEGPVAEPAEAGAARERAAGLDAFRGLFLLAMNFAFTIPFGVFAQWMYHIQFPSPEGDFAPIAGLGWRDTLFGGFLFAMAAALPITMGARLAKGVPYPGILWIAAKRAFLLFVFALIIGHVNPYWTGDYTKTGNVMAIVGFVVCFWLFTRPRATWDPAKFKWFRRAGWAAAAALLFLGPTIYDASFSLERRDDIIASIAFSALAGTTVWLATRRNLLARTAVVAAVLALKLAAREPGWVQTFWSDSPLPWLFQPWYIELLLIVIPGTIVGDLLVRWMRPPTPGDAKLTWSGYRLTWLALIAASFVPVLLVGTYTRYTATTTLVVAALALGGALLARPARTGRERVLAGIFAWGAFWLLLGMLLEPFEGGIKKVPQTLSYLFVSAGLSSMILLACVIVADAFGHGRRLLRPLVEVGQNPMLAYVVYMLGLNHLLYLLGIGDFLTGSATEATIRGFLIAGVVSALVWAASRARLYWRA
ncbi:MAG TPA: DUF5009 domain-containing protein [Longimicrobiales bacterium]